MFDWFKNLLGVQPKRGAVHPGVAASRARGRVMAVGVVYDKNGAPKLAPDFLVNMPGYARTAVYNDLLAHGWQLNPDNTVTKIQEN